MKFNFIEVEKTENGVFRLWINRPDKRNAFTPTFINEIDFALKDANSDNNIKIVEIRAKGKVFSAGMDLSAFLDPSLDTSNAAFENRDLALAQVIYQLNKPSIAIIHASAFAGAFLLFLPCTYIFIEKSAELSLPEIRLGLFPFQVLEGLLERMPPNQAMRLCLNTEKIDAQQAIEANLANYIFDSNIERSMEYNKLIYNLLSNAPIATIAGFKAMKRIKKSYTLQQQMKILLEELRDTEDAKEGIQAFFEKRSPEWKGC